MAFASSLVAHEGRYAVTIVNLLSHAPIVAAVILNASEFDTSEQHFTALGKRFGLIRSKTPLAFLCGLTLMKEIKSLY